MARIITIGRNPISDCCIPQNFDKVSNNHAEIEEHNGRLILIDHSSNGTMVNGRKVHNTQIEITYGDDIRLANTYLLSWNTIKSFFPEQNFSTRPIDSDIHGRATQIYNTPVNSEERFGRADDMYSIESIRERERARAGWNWGAFLLGWIWGVGHSIVWPLFVVIGLTIILVVLPTMVPPSLIITLWIYNLLIFALNIYLGVKGNDIAWENGCFDNVSHFKTKERKWTIAALIVYGFWLLSVITLYIIGWGSLFLLFNSL